jgi:uncharacterized RDD family membrane protein YckC
MPLMLALISEPEWTGFQTAMYVIAAIVCGWIPALLALRARRENGFATVWDLASGTRVVVQPKGTVRSSVEPATREEIPGESAASLGPYQIIKEMVPGKWILAMDPVLRRQVWLLPRTSEELPVSRQNLARPGRPRWLQTVETPDATWDAFEASQGVPFSHLVEGGKRIPWGTLRHWLHDLASELWAATGDDTLPTELSLDHVWITAQGHAVLLDEPWPRVNTHAEQIPVRDLAGQQRFLNAVAAFVESTGLPLHARPALKNLEDQKFEKLSFLTGNLRGLLDRSAEVSQGIRAASLFMLPLYVWIALFVGYYHDKELPAGNVWIAVAWMVMNSAMLVLGTVALAQLLEVPFRTTCSHTIFGLAVVNANGKPASVAQWLVRWAIVWLPLLLVMPAVALLMPRAEGISLVSAYAMLLMWLSAAIYAVVHPHQGLHDRLAGTWVVRR